MWQRNMGWEERIVEKETRAGWETLSAFSVYVLCVMLTMRILVYTLLVMLTWSYIDFWEGGQTGGNVRRMGRGERETRAGWETLSSLIWFTCYGLC